jgi:hypothetical protein
MAVPTIAQIEADMIAAKNNEPLLAPLNSPSNTAIWRLWVWLVAVAHQVIYAQWDKTKVEISQIAAQQIVGTAAWYQAMVLDWAYTPTGINIVTRCSVRENATKVIIKVAKSGATGIVNLAIPELQELRYFVKTHKIVGSDIDVISQTADLVSLRISIRYTGVQATVQSAVVQGIKDYLATLPFDVALSKGLLADYLLGNVQGVADAYVDEMSINLGLGYQVIPTNSVQSDAGYFEVGTSSSGDLITLNMYQ